MMYGYAGGSLLRNIGTSIVPGQKAILPGPVRPGEQFGIMGMISISAVNNMSVE